MHEQLKVVGRKNFTALVFSLKMEIAIFRDLFDFRPLDEGELVQGLILVSLESHFPNSCPLEQLRYHELFSSKSTKHGGEKREFRRRNTLTLIN